MIVTTLQFSALNFFFSFLKKRERGGGERRKSGKVGYSDGAKENGRERREGERKKEGERKGGIGWNDLSKRKKN